MTADTIITNLWQPQDKPEDPYNNTRVHISQVVRKLQPFGWTITHVRDFGYRLERITDAPLNQH